MNYLDVHTEQLNNGGKKETKQKHIPCNQCTSAWASHTVQSHHILDQQQHETGSFHPLTFSLLPILSPVLNPTQTDALSPN